MISFSPAAHDEHVLDRVGAPVQRGIHGVLQWEHLAFAPPSVGRDDELGLGVVDPVAQTLGAEAAEYDRIHRADAGDREHGDHRLRNHRHVDRDAVALADAERLESVRGTLHLGGQLGVGHRAVSPGSPSQWNATRSPLPSST